MPHNGMYKHLSKKEKQKKLAQAKRRAVLWSIQEQRRKTLQTTVSLEQLSTTTTVPSPTKEVDNFFPALSEPIQTTSSVDSSSEPTIAALTAIIHDLIEQRHKLDITIQVLNRRLQEILSQRSPTDQK